MNKPNSGVTCDVVSCMYNDDASKCTASVIHVGDSRAHSCGETRCDTFTEK